MPLDIDNFDGDQLRQAPKLLDRENERLVRQVLELKQKLFRWMSLLQLPRCEDGLRGPRFRGVLKGYRGPAIRCARVEPVALSAVSSSTAALRLAAVPATEFQSIYVFEHILLAVNMPGAGATCPSVLRHCDAYSRSRRPLRSERAGSTRRR